MKKLLAVVIFGLSFIPTSLYINSKVSEERYVAVVQECLPKTVTIYVNVLTDVNKHGRFIGSGVFVSANGHILSCAHLFESTDTIESVVVETDNGWLLPATVLFVDKKRDLSLIKIEEKNTPYATLAPLHTIVEGLEVVAIGAPLGLSGTVTTGIVSALHRDQIRYDQIQMSAPINPGNSGGPLFNRKGELIGINVNLMTESPFPTWCGLGFSVSAAEINKFLTNFKGLDRATRAQP